jgi:MFS family permease
MQRRGLTDIVEDRPSVSRKWPVITALGFTQIFAWGSSYYLLAVLAGPVARDTGWPLPWVIGGLSLGLVIAGFSSPMVGRTIAQAGGRRVLAVSAMLLAAGLLVLSAAHSLPVYFVGWAVMGLGMGCGLYDPAFATLGRLYGQEARSSITILTLFGGFASTVCWPLSAFFEAHLGWRGACLAYAAIQLGLAVPLYVFALPRKEHAAVSMHDDARTVATVVLTGSERLLFLLLAVTITLASFISAAFSVHLLTVLQGQGVALSSAVALGALVGPSQVSARAIEMAIGRYHHPIGTKLASASLLAAGLAGLWFGSGVVVPALMLYGAGIGLESIARGTLPLAIFGAGRYPVLMGRIARPSLILQAAAPFIGALLIEKGGANGILKAFLAASIMNVLLVFILAAMLAARARTSSLSPSRS